MMTPKHYIALAAALNAMRPGPFLAKGRHLQYTADVQAIAKVLADDNPNFDRQRFYTAAGLVQIGPDVHSVYTPK